MKVKCPNCGRMDFVTTDKYDPNITPHGGMVRSLLPYQIDWLTMSTTLAAEMTCPECLAQLAPSGKLWVINDIKDPADLPAPEEAVKAEAPKVGAKVYVCDVCGKEFGSALALSGHSRSHKKEE